MSYLLKVRGDFCAAHAIHHYQGKCEKLHGHNFAVEIAIKGHEPDPATGMVLDFAILKKALRTVLGELDHTVLNELPHFQSISPSSENIAQFIGHSLLELLATELTEAKVSLQSVAVSEKNSQQAIWLKDD